MDYTGFVRAFYRTAITKLKDFKNYYGRMVNINKDLDIPSDFLHDENSKNLFLPPFSLNINSPTNYFIDYMDYYVALMPDLGYVLANKNRINELYNNCADLGFLENDEEAQEFIEFTISIGIKVLEQQGILERASGEENYGGEVF